MSELTDAFDEALDGAEDAKGFREKVTFQGRQLDALFNEQTDDIQPVDGGLASVTPITVSVRTREVTLPIARLAPILVRGNPWAVLIVKPREGRMDLVVGDPAAELGST